MIIKTVGCLDQEQSEQKNRTESSEIDPNPYENLKYDEVTYQIKTKKDELFKKCFRNIYLVT